MAEAASRAAARPANLSRRPPPQRRARAKAYSARAGFRWARVATLVAAVVLGLPLVHAMFGEVAALLGGAVALGFLLGRWTA
jgi:hypothetical protein